MPIYEYRCEACGRLHEALQKVSDDPLRSCPVCKKRKLKRLMSAPRFRLKGAGWYETDFKSDNEKKRNLAESGGEADRSAGGDSGDGAKGGAKEGAKEAAKEAAKEGAKEGAKESSKTGSAEGTKDGAASGARTSGKTSAKRSRTANLAAARRKKGKTPRR